MTVPSISFMQPEVIRLLKAGKTYPQIKKALQDKWPDAGRYPSPSTVSVEARRAGIERKRPTAHQVYAYMHTEIKDCMHKGMVYGAILGHLKQKFPGADRYPSAGAISRMRKDWGIPVQASNLTMKIRALSAKGYPPYQIVKHLNKEGAKLSIAKVRKALGTEDTKKAMVAARGALPFEGETIAPGEPNYMQAYAAYMIEKVPDHRVGLEIAMRKFCGMPAEEPAPYVKRKGRHLDHKKAKPAQDLALVLEDTEETGALLELAA